MTKYTWTVVEYTAPSIGVSRGSEVAKGLTRAQVVARFGDGVDFDPGRHQIEPHTVPHYTAEPEWRL